MKTSVVISYDGLPCLLSPLHGEIISTIREAKKIGFDAIQLILNKPSELNVDLIQKLILESKIEISGIATGRAFTVDNICIGSSDANIRIAAIKRLKEHIELANKLNTPNVIIGAIRGDAKQAESYLRHEKNVTDSLLEILPYAQEKKVTLTIEAISKSELDSSDLFYDIKKLVNYIKKFNSAHLKLHLDTYQMLLQKQDPFDTILITEDFLAQVDISDRNRTYPSGISFDFKRLIEALNIINFAGYLTFEYQNEPQKNTAQLGLEYINSIIQGRNKIYPYVSPSRGNKSSYMEPRPVIVQI